MEESIDSKVEVKTEGSQNKILPFVLIVVLLIGIGIFALRKPSKEEVLEMGKGEEQSAKVTMTVTPAIIANYKDGKYVATGNYTSPAGDESVEVKITLKSNVITEAEVISKATKPKSITMQNLFIGGFMEMVVGKNINEVKLDKVSGSSLTSKGFNDAIEKIKTVAKV